MPGSFRIGTIAGLTLYIHFSWFIILFLLTFSLAFGWFPALYPGQSIISYLFLGLIASLLLFVSVVLHEMAHSLVARSRGLPVRNIVLFIFGGVSNIQEEPHSPGTEFLMAVVGPLVSLIIGAICYGLFYLFRGAHSPFVPMLAYLGLANILLGVFNLLPGFPLDGGRVLRSIVWKATGSAYRATQIATRVGAFIAYLFILVGIWIFFFSRDPFNGIWLGFIGWFLLTAAHASRSQATLDTLVQGATVGEFMKKDPITVPANISLRRLIDEYILPQGLRSAPVMQADRFVGLITLKDIQRVPRDDWERIPVGLVMKPVEQLHTVTPQHGIKDALPLMSRQDVNQLPVLENGQLVGMLTRDAVIRSLEIRQQLGLERSENASG
ncbi:Zn-dependent protease [Thermosporothrix hazakensis]|jgi:Zn-dependent protease/CBS domain-containing protein|uniref:Zinc metalloprotease n=1 Tax=Thermosporothrix hazakensis TaxID=644383 RepID=A0A326U9I4_THEHA|nr:site-2 protease family protein [Thermosporothrix hazakensis]PZW31197.1 Zn-dependent protease [Thermosporothrix hazakensis]GCE50892.1 peptidase M50 [Thermosporothrix hazakensis]